MSGWITTPADGWPSIAEALSSTGAPWPEAAAITDLRWYEDKGLEIPGRPTLRARWRWTDWAVRTLLQREDDWRDPIRRQPTASAPPALRQRSASRPPAPTRANADSKADSASAPPALRQPTASRPPAGLHTRGDPPSPSPSPSQEGEEARAREGSPPPSPSGADRDGQQPAAAPSWAVGWTDIPPAEVVSDVCAVLAVVRGRSVRPAEAGREAALVRGALDRTADSLPELQGQAELVIAWGLGCAEGQDELGGVRARTGERWGQDRTRMPSWVLGPRWPDWLDMARAWESRGRVASSTGPPVRGEHPGRHAQPTEEDWAAMEELRRQIEAEQRAGAAK